MGKRVCHSRYGKTHAATKNMDYQTRKAFQAIWDGDLKALKRSLRKVKDVNARRKTKASGRLGGKTMLHEAVMASNKEAVQLLLEQPQIDAKACFIDVLQNCWTPISIAEMHCSQAILEILREHIGKLATTQTATTATSSVVAETDKTSRAIGKEKPKTFCQTNNNNAWVNALQSNLPSHQIAKGKVWGQAIDDRSISSEGKAMDSVHMNETNVDAMAKEGRPFSLFSESACMNSLIPEHKAVVEPFSIDSWLKEVSLSRKLLRPRDILNLDLAESKEEEEEEKNDDRMGMTTLSASNACVFLPPVNMLVERNYTVSNDENEEKQNEEAKQSKQNLHGWSEEALAKANALTYAKANALTYAKAKVSPPPGFDGSENVSTNVVLVDTTNKVEATICDVSSNGNCMKSLTRTQRRRVQRIRAKHQRRILEASLAPVLGRNVRSR